MKRLLFCLLLAIASAAAAEDVYQQPDAFLAETFGEVPRPQVLWITPERKPKVREILGHDLNSLRVRYWRDGERTAWILEEIGKERPITTGYVVNQGRIERVKVLIYRESRGFEVRHPFFTDQFRGAELTEANRLSKSIDSISGATLSVGALKRLAALALYFHDEVTKR
jgi:hypothetical protein